MKILKDRRGVTLMEMIVAIGVFLILSVLLVDIYLLLSRAQGFLRSQSEVVSESSRILGEMAAVIHTGRIDYDSYPPIPNVRDQLHIINQDGVRISWRVNDQLGPEGCLDEQHKPCLQRRAGGDIWRDVVRSVLRVRKASFFAFPEENPFDEAGEAVNQQPRVTIMLELEKTEKRVGETPSPIVMQTSISPRFYAR